MSAFATVDEVQARLDWTLDDGERNLAMGALEDLSDEARHHGRAWTAETVPGSVKRLVIKATARYLRNPDGYEQSRAGDETVIWNHASKTPGSAEFTEPEIKAIRALTRPQSFGSMQMTAWDTKPGASEVGQFVPDDGIALPFTTEPW